MTHCDPLLPIRRVVGESVSNLKCILAAGKKQDKPRNARTLRFESLEERRVLSANGFDGDGSSDSGFVAPDDSGSVFGLPQNDAISYVKILVNETEIHELTASSNRLELVRGDVVEVVEIGVETTDQTGVFAAEAYVSKIGDLTSASLIDYNDGRFSDPSRDFVANGGDGAIRGLNNHWDMQEGWDRMTINLMHYDVDSTEVAGRFFINVQVGKPDFEYDTEHLDSILQQEIHVGDEVTIPARWTNNLAGNFHNYAEVDIYHASDTDKIVWAGALAGNASESNVVEGEFLNDREDDPFSEKWTPDVSGEYILKYYLDPEHVVSEASEGNNLYEIRVSVNEESTPAPIAVDDAYQSRDRVQILDVMNNDIPTRDGETIYEEDFESDSLAWTTNPYGTDTATTGLWEATDPVGTSWNGVQLQLENAANGKQALVTGGKDDGSAGLDDVDGGVTSALSQSIVVPANADAVLSFKYTFAHLDNATNHDFFRVTVIGQTESKVVLEERAASTDRAGHWQTFEADVSEFAGQDIQLLVEAADHKDKSLVEAGIDEVSVRIPASEMMIDDFSQGEHGSVSLNEDGTFEYVAEAGFSGQDEFKYTVTDGENISNIATVTVNVDAKEFAVQPKASGDEDSEISLNITSDYDLVRIEGVPAGAVLNKGEPTSEGTYELTPDQLEGLTVTPAENSDQDFLLTVTPVDNGVDDSSAAATIDVMIHAVVDGGVVQFADFGIVTGKKGEVPVSSKFVDLDGSESHRITIQGLPSFVSLNHGELDGENWILDDSDLVDLRIEADKVRDTSGWSDYDKKYLFRAFEITFTVDSFEANGSDHSSFSDQFEFFAFQKKK